MNFIKFEVYGNPTLWQGGWERTGGGNNYIKYTDPADPFAAYRICTLEYVPQHHPHQITITGIANKELEVSVLALRSDNYIISAFSWQDNGYTFNLGSTYDKLGVMFRFKNGDTITPNLVSFDTVGKWLDSHYIKGTDTDTITTLPATIYPLAQTATVGLKGNEQHTGTPTPDNPIMPQGTGDKTANLFTGNIESGGWAGLNGQVPTKAVNDTRLRIDNIFKLDAQKNYTITVFPTTLQVAVMTLDNENKRTSDTGWSDANYQNINNAYGVVITIRKPDNTSVIVNDCEGIMISEGTTVPSTYEPYGNKIPISSNSITTPVYLGEVESTRWVKKLVLTGDENWYVEGSDIFYTNPITEALRYAPICSHYKGVYIFSGNNQVTISQTLRINIKTTTITHTASDFKTYLQQQYAAGTPVTVWYVLATEETAIVNEPLMKIGTYADSISGISIPTTAGANTLDVDTTVKPSEVTAAFNGWHPVSSAHERSGGSWD